MTAIQTIQLGEHEFIYRGKTRMATVVAYVYRDPDLQLDGEFAPGEKEKILDDIERGRLDPCGIEVRASCYEVPGTVSLSGSDTCWGFLIRRPSDVTDAIRDQGMIYASLSELARTLDDALKDARALIAEFTE